LPLISLKSDQTVWVICRLNCASMSKPHSTVFSIEFCLHTMYISTHSVYTSICHSWFGRLSQSPVTRITPCYCHHVLLLTCPHSSNKVCPLVRAHLSNVNRGRRKGWSTMKQPLHCTAFTLFHVAHSRSPHNVLPSPTKYTCQSYVPHVPRGSLLILVQGEKK